MKTTVIAYPHPNVEVIRIDCPPIRGTSTAGVAYSWRFADAPTRASPPTFSAMDAAIADSARHTEYTKL